MSSNADEKAPPQSMRHKRIMDVAEKHPDASIDELASMVSSATPDLVEEVLAKHGDPASEDETPAEAGTATPVEAATAGSDESSDGGLVTTDGGPDTDRVDGTAEDGGKGSDGDTEPARVPSLEDLSEKQREVLTEVAVRPEATQKEIARRLDVSRATVSNRVNSIDGFEWREREPFVEAVFDEPPSTDVVRDGGPSSEASSTDARETELAEPSPSEEAPERTADLESTLTQLESRLSDLEATHTRSKTNADSVFEDPELVHKVIHACLKSDSISESEELRILKELVE